jgi:carboxymethylenebutenolidase
MGGRHVLRAAVAFPDRMRAGASLHGTALVTEAPNSPHLEAARNAEGELYCGFGANDPYTPPSTVAALKEALTGA